MFLNFTFVFVFLSLSTEETASFTVLSHYSKRLINLQLQLSWQFEVGSPVIQGRVYSICLIKVEFKAVTSLGIPDFSVFCLNIN